MPVKILRANGFRKNIVCESVVKAIDSMVKPIFVYGGNGYEQNRRRLRRTGDIMLDKGRTVNMSQDVTKYNILISCPGDIKTEVGIINEVVQEFNQCYSDNFGIVLQIKHWSKDSFPQSGGHPQELINKQIVQKCDAVIALFWTRFGTPTDKYGSGTEEEIEEMIKARKQVFLYFCEKPIKPSEKDDKGYQKVCDFKEKYNKNGLSYRYDNEDGFRNALRKHLINFFLSKTESKANNESANYDRKEKFVGKLIEELTTLVKEDSEYWYGYLSPQNEVRRDSAVSAYLSLRGKLASIDCASTLWNEIDAFHRGEGVGIGMTDGRWIDAQIEKIYAELEVFKKTYLNL